jgi:hypothetical protein
MIKDFEEGLRAADPKYKNMPARDLKKLIMDSLRDHQYMNTLKEAKRDQKRLYLMDVQKRIGSNKPDVRSIAKKDPDIRKWWSRSLRGMGRRKREKVLSEGRESYVGRLHGKAVEQGLRPRKIQGQQRWLPKWTDKGSRG